MTSTGSKGTRQPEADGNVKEAEEDFWRGVVFLKGGFFGRGFLRGDFWQKVLLVKMVYVFHKLF